MEVLTQEEIRQDNPSKPTKKVARRAPNMMALTLTVVALIMSGLTFPYWHLVHDKTVADAAPTTGVLPQRPDVEPWQQKLRQRLLNILKVNLSNTKAMKSKIVEDQVVRTLMYDGNYITCRRQTIEFESSAGTPVFAYLLLPQKMPDGVKLPCVICLPGHGAGVDHAVGIDSDGTLMKMWDKTPRDFALFFAYRGYAVLAMEQAGIGRRAHPLPAVPFAEKAECLLSDAKLRFKGKTSLGERVSDVFRAIDLLSTRKEVDMNRLAIMGISAGGTTALYSAALDERIKCAIVVSAVSTYKDSIFRQVQCMCNYVPGLPGVCDPTQVAALVAPRALFVESGTTDDRFPARSARIVWEKVRDFYTMMGSEKKIGLDVCEHGHRCFFGKRAIEFLQQVL